MEAAERAQQLLGLADEAAARLGREFAERSGDAAKGHLVRQEAESLFLFVTLSVLLEGRPGQDPGDRNVAAALKDALARRIIETKRRAQKLAERTLDQEKARRFGLRLDETAAEDPFLPYYDSFDKAREDPDQGPFSIFAQRLSAAHGLPDPLCQRLLTISLQLADDLVEGIHPSNPS